MNTETLRPSDRLESRARPAPCCGCCRRSRSLRRAVLLVLVVIGRTTEWGRQFWRITGDYFKGRQSLPVWAMVALLLLSTIISVRITCC